MIELLVQYGADINATTRSGQSILGLLFLISPALFGILLKNGRFIKCLALYSSASPSLFYQMRPIVMHNKRVCYWNGSIIDNRNVWAGLDLQSFARTTISSSDCSSWRIVSSNIVHSCAHRTALADSPSPVVPAALTVAGLLNDFQMADTVFRANRRHAFCNALWKSRSGRSGDGKRGRVLQLTFYEHLL